MTSTCIDSHYITTSHSHDTGSPSWHPSTGSCSTVDTLNPLQRYRTGDLDVGPGLSDTLSPKPDGTSDGVTGCSRGCRVPSRAWISWSLPQHMVGQLTHPHLPSADQLWLGVSHEARLQRSRHDIVWRGRIERLCTWPTIHCLDHLTLILARVYSLIINCSCTLLMAALAQVNSRMQLSPLIFSRFVLVEVR
jgi:hypothetical protein